MWCYAVVEEVRRSASAMCIIHQGHTSSILTNLIKRTVGLYLKCIINMSNYNQSKNLKKILIGELDLDSILNELTK